MASANASNLHGRTEEGEVCKCMPGSVEPLDPESTWDFSKWMPKLQADPKTAVSKEKYQKMVKHVNDAMAPTLARVSQELEASNQSLMELKEAAAKAEGAASTLRDSFREVRNAYSAGGCDSVLRDIEKRKKLAEDQGAAPPVEDSEPLECDKSTTNAIEELTRRINAAQPKCEAGATALESMRHASMTPQLLVAILNTTGAAKTPSAGILHPGDGKWRRRSPRGRAQGRSRWSDISAHRARVFL